MQVQRLKEHVEKKHADVESPEEEEASLQERGPAPQVISHLHCSGLLTMPNCHAIRQANPAAAPGQDHGRQRQGRLLHREVAEDAAARVVHRAEAAHAALPRDARR